MTYRDEVLEDGPVSYWPLDEPAGATEAANLVPGGLPLVHSSGVTTGVPAGPPGIGLAVTYPAADVSTRAGIPAGMAANVTLEAWVDVPATGRGAFVSVSDGGLRGYSVGMGASNFSTTGSKLLGLLDYVRWINDTPTLVAGWRHVVMTVAGGTVILYLDGAEVASSTGTGPRNPTTGPVRVGGWLESTGIFHGFTGSIGEVALYAKVLTPERVAAHYEAGLQEPPSLWHGSTAVLRY